MFPSTGSGSFRRSRACWRRGDGHHAVGDVHAARSFSARNAGTCTAPPPTWSTVFWSIRIWVRCGLREEDPVCPHSQPLCSPPSPDPKLPSNFCLLTPSALQYIPQSCSFLKLPSRSAHLSKQVHCRCGAPTCHLAPTYYRAQPHQEPHSFHNAPKGYPAPCSTQCLLPT